MDGLNSRMEEIDEGIVEMEERTVGFTQLNNRKKIDEKEWSIKDIWDYSIQSPRRRRKREQD